MVLLFYVIGIKDSLLSLEELFMNIWNVLLWAGVTIVLIVAEIVTVQLVAVWIAGGALASLITALFTTDLKIQLLVFVVVSIILLIATRPLVKKINKNRPLATNADSVIGKTAVVTEDIDNDLSTGRVKVDGVFWAARTADNSKIKKDDLCKIIEIRGVKLFVEKQNEA